MKKKVRRRHVVVGVEKDYQTLVQKLRDQKFRAAALSYLEAEVRHHYKGKIDFTAAVKRCRFFSQLSSRLDAEFRTLQRSYPHYGGKGKSKILQFHGLARSRLDIANVRERIRETNGGVDPNQFIPVTVVLFSTRTALELGGAPVVSLNQGCPICGTHAPP
jgi:hypothetical protein